MSNPLLSESRVERRVGLKFDTMTVGGVVAKTAILLGILVVGYLLTFNMLTANYKAEFDKVIAHPIMKNGVAQPAEIPIPPNAIILMVVGSVVGLALVIIICAAKASAPYISPIYAFIEGAVLGALSAGAEACYPGVALEAGMATIGSLFLMLILYAIGLKPTGNFVMGVVTATFGVLLFYVTDIVLGLFGCYIPVLHQGGFASLIVSLVICIIAALNLIIDFGQVEENVGVADKSMEWYCAFGLIVTLVWLYLEILRLLMILRGEK